MPLYTVGQRIRIFRRGAKADETSTDISLAATVRWLDLNTENVVERLGVETDTHHPARHSGKGLFECPEGTGMIVQVNSVDSGISVLSAFNVRYKAGGVSESESKWQGKVTETILDDGRSVLVGATKVDSFYADSANWIHASLDRMGISSLGCTLELSEKARNVTHLSLCNNLLWNWKDVVNAAAVLPFLEYLNLSSNRFAANTILDCANTGDAKESTSQQPSRLSELILNNTGMKPLVVGKAISALPGSGRSVKILSLVDNSITGLELRAFETLGHTLGNHIEALSLVRNPVDLPLDQALCLFGQWRELKSLNISECKISDSLSNAESLPRLNSSTYSDTETLLGCSLRELIMSGNLISQWSSLKLISGLFGSSMKELRIMDNPIFDSNANPFCRQIIVSVFPKLAILNASHVSREQRKDYERFCVSKKPEGFLASLTAARRVEIFDENMVPDLNGTASLIKTAPSTAMKCSNVSVTVNSKIVLPVVFVPPSTTVSQLCLLLCRRLNVAQISCLQVETEKNAFVHIDPELDANRTWDTIVSSGTHHEFSVNVDVTVKDKP